MSRKPIDIEAAEQKGKPFGRQAMWEAMLANPVWNVADIARVSRRAKSSVRTYMQRLVNGGYVVIDEGHTTPHTAYYRVARNIGHEAPRLKVDGSPLIEARDQMWRAMKILSHFSAVDLAVSATTEECPVNPNDAASYVVNLKRAGYLIVVTEASTSGGRAVYKLRPSMNTGPHAPKVQRSKCVWDPNRNAVMWHEEMDA